MNPHSSPDPGVVGVGIDLADVARLSAALERRDGLAGRLFTSTELSTMGLGASGSSTGGPSGGRPSAPVRTDPVRVAQRFAAKEAVMKALGAGIDSIRFTEIELTARLDDVVLTGRAARRASVVGAERWSVEVGVVEGPDGPVATAEVIASSSLR